ncbi:hypothetical protein OS493_032362 [Desmophyllum pertusum]|uniref:Mab-21-like nucleotidyltransferase domain-containing protein n=1 Tax=Desmophyllum pertusum TaxID=174260 RepID=A0A9X0CHV5_9CNID|nr:hypothetical protein OS493_032362 [Desmophyllum pertusum]
MAQAQAQRGDSLTKKLRDYSVKYVKISEDDMSRSKMLVKDYIEDQIMVYCRQKSSLAISRLEYTGSMYEKLKPEAADEVDIMVVLKSEVMVEDPGVPGYVRLMAQKDSNIRKYANPEGYINPERIRNGWFYSLVDRAIRDFRARSPGSDIHLVPRYHGPAVQLDIFRKGAGEKREKLLSADLVPCFQVGPDYYVAKTYTSWRRSVSSPDLLWRQSFSLKEKEILEYMDRDHGCRHELLRIVKTIVKRHPESFKKLARIHTA